MQWLFNPQFLNDSWTATVGPALIGLAGLGISLWGRELYGGSLFVVLPFIVSFVSAYCWSYQREVGYWSAYRTACMSFLVFGLFLLFLGIEGLVCLVLAAPIALIQALLGVFLGRKVGSSVDESHGHSLPLFLCLGFPFVVGIEDMAVPNPTVRQVRTSVKIDAPIEDVWKTVIEFPEITDPPRGIFRFGIAYPIKANIEGSGVGAVRHCTFSTGSFVEPITKWAAPHRLSFDVTENPPPMKELGFYDEIHAPHLHGHFIARSGEFRLSRCQDGSVLLEGTTWYTHSLAPEFYWGPISDAIIHRIHLRVLNHISRHAG